MEVVELKLTLGYLNANDVIYKESQLTTFDRSIQHEIVHQQAAPHLHSHCNRIFYSLSKWHLQRHVTFSLSLPSWFPPKPKPSAASNALSTIGTSTVTPTLFRAHQLVNAHLR